MAHTLTIAGLDFSGSSYYKVKNYTFGAQENDISKSFSAYTDGVRPVASRKSSVIDSVVFDVHALDRDHALRLVRSVGEALDRARRYFEEESNLVLEVAIKPTNTTDTAYATIYGGGVSVFGEVLGPEMGAYVISDCVAYLEREPNFRPATATALVNTDTATSVGKSSDLTVYGDLGAQVAILRLNHDTPAGTGSNVYIGYAGSEQYGSAYASHLGRFNAKDQSLNTDTTTAADGAAISGTATTTSFATAATETERFSLSGVYPWGRIRVFARMKCGAGTTCAARWRYEWGASGGGGLIDGGTTRYSNTVSVTGTTYKWYDMGALHLPLNETANDYLVYGIAANSVFSFLASRTSGANDLKVDSVFFMPLESGLVRYTSTTGRAFTWGNARGITAYTAQRPYSGTVTGALKPPPGLGRLYWLACDGDYGGYATTDVIVQLYIMPQYSWLRGIDV